MNARLPVSLIVLSLLAPVGLAQVDAEGPNPPPAWDAEKHGPLPRYRPNVPPVDPNQPLHPYAVHADTGGIAAVPNGLIASPPEYAPTKGVLFRYDSTAWPTVVRDCVVALTAPGHDEIAYVVVNSAAQQSSAISSFTAGGADMSKVQFIVKTTESIWARDYGPHFIWQDGTLAIADSHYYPTRPNDNFIPTNAGVDYFGVATYPMDLYYSGGNFQPGPNRSGFVTNLINADNPEKSNALIAELYQRYQGIDTLHIFPRLPSTVDATGHIDMWLYLVDEDTVIISQFIAGSNATAISVTNNAVPYMQNLGFTVHRPPAWNAGGVHYTYANAFRVNNRIFTPKYGGTGGSASYTDEDATALAVWQTAAGPGVTIVPIQCYGIIPAAGAIHCIVMQVPRYVDALPAAVVVSPKGGELCIGGDLETIRWNATDDETITNVGLYYSLDDGANWTLIANTTNSGSFNWTVPSGSSGQARLKVAVTDNDNNTIEAVSALPFSIRPGTVNSYTFASGGGVDKFGFGSSTGAWGNIDANRTPVTVAISSTNYPRLATSNASGGISDANRYISATPSSGWESTHTYEFLLGENPADIGEIELTWEGFAQDCTNVELYVWDAVAGNWSDAAGQSGQNRAMDTYSGLRDGVLRGAIRSDFERYLVAGNRLTMLIYADRTGDLTVHDFVAVRVKLPETLLAGDLNCDGTVDFFDIDPFLIALFDPAAYATTYPDCDISAADMNADASVDFFDIDPFLTCLFGGTCP